jgi:hypothetical protein
MRKSMFGHQHRLGLTRREVLQVGYSGLLGLGLPAILNGRASGSESPIEARRARSVVLIFLTGGPSHLDTFDPKPDAAPEIRGEFQTIPTTVSGLRLSEHLPSLAARMHRLAVMRSMTHRNPNHLMATHHVITGQTVPNKAEDFPGDKSAAREDWPCFASVLDYLRPRSDGIPTGVMLPYHLVEGPLTWPGQNAGFLGPKHDPWQVHKDPNAADFRIDSLQMPAGFEVTRLSERRTLLDRVNRQLDGLSAAGAFGDQQRQAFAVLAAGEVARAFNLEREPPRVRDRYGRHLFGQSLLLARRLVQAGVPMIQANMGIVQTWDNHADIFATLKNRLLPPLDRGVSALLDDMESLGLLDETLVVLVGEFGRTPKLSTLPGQTKIGRDHWPGAFFAVFAGAGVRGGQVIGRSDRIGGYPASKPYHPSDLAATVYSALGIPSSTIVRDTLGRPQVLNHGDVIQPLYDGVGS